MTILLNGSRTELFSSSSVIVLLYGGHSRPERCRYDHSPFSFGVLPSVSIHGPVEITYHVCERRTDSKKPGFSHPFSLADLKKAVR